MGNLHLIIFITSVAFALKAEEFEEIHRAATAYNTKHNITGMIVHGNGNTFHIIEGAESDVREKFNLLSRDIRLSTFIKLVDKPIISRYFEDIPFAFKPLSSVKLAHLDDFKSGYNNDLLQMLLELEDSNMKLLKDFIKNNI